MFVQCVAVDQQAMRPSPKLMHMITQFQGVSSYSLLSSEGTERRGHTHTHIHIRYGSRQLLTIGIRRLLPGYVSMPVNCISLSCVLLLDKLLFNTWFAHGGGCIEADRCLQRVPNFMPTIFK